MSEAVIERVKQRLMDGTLSRDEAAIVLGKLKGKTTQESQQQPQESPDRPKVTGGRGIAAQQQERELFDLRQESERQGLPLVRDLKEIIWAPELNEMNLGSMGAAAGTMFTFDDEESGKILQEQLGAEIGQDVEGNYFARFPSGDYAINAPGPSVEDAFKIAGPMAAFTPASRAATLTGMVGGGMATQAAIEGLQTGLGGDFDAEEVIVAGAAPVVMSKITSLGKAAADKITPKATQSIIDDIGKTADDAKPVSKPVFESSTRAMARQGLADNTVEGVGWRIGRRGRIVPDKLEREVVKSGLEDRAVVNINSMNKEERKLANKMLEKARRYMRAEEGADIDLPNSVVGESAMKRFNAVKNFQNKAGNKIERAVRQNASERVDTNQISDDFMDALERAGVDFGDDIDFGLSQMANSNVAPIKTAIRWLEEKPPTFENLHNLKRQIYDQVSYAKGDTASQKMNDSGEKIMKDLARKVNDKLRAMSDDYRSANDEFSAAADVVTPFAKAMGRKFDPASDRVEDLSGQELRKILSNYSTGQTQLSAYTALDNFARGTGAEFSDNIRKLISLNSSLENAFGSFKPGSMQGIGEKVMNQAVREKGGIVGEAAMAVVDKGKESLFWQAPTVEKLKTLGNIQELINRGSK